jgi:hypothetical protein
VPIRDPGDRTRILDFWYAVTFERAGTDLQELEAELWRALGLEKAATTRR